MTFKPDLIGLTEVKPKNSRYNIIEQDLQIEGYTMYTNLNGRGSALYINNSIKSFEIKLNQCSDASVWCGIPLMNHDRLLVGVCYRSPNSTDQQNQLLTDMLNGTVLLKYSHTLIMGDFNYPEIDWQRQATSESLNHASSGFVECVRDCFLFQQVRQPTHYSGSDRAANIRDLVFTSEEGMSANMKYEVPIGNSHHVLISWTTKCYTDRMISKVDKYSYETGNYDGMRDDLGRTNWTEILKDKSIDDMWNIILHNIMSAVRTHVTHRSVVASSPQVRRRKPAWMNEKLLTRIKKKKKAFERYQTTRDGLDYLAYIGERNAVNKETRKAVRDFEKDIASIAKKDPKKFFRYVNSKVKTKTGIGDLYSEDGVMTADNKEKANVLNRFFSSVFTIEDNDKFAWRCTKKNIK